MAKEAIRGGQGWAEVTGGQEEEGCWEESLSREEVEVKLVCNYSPTLLN